MHLLPGTTTWFQFLSDSRVERRELIHASCPSDLSAYTVAYTQIAKHNLKGFVLKSSKIYLRVSSERWPGTIPGNLEIRRDLWVPEARDTWQAEQKLGKGPSTKRRWHFLAEERA